MNYGLYLSASGVLTNMYRQDVFANNLANIQTPAFKADVPAIRQRDAEAVEDRLGGELSHELLDRLGGGALAAPQMIDFKPGEMMATGRDLDAALPGEDDFFAVEFVDPQTKRVSVGLTRDGRFSRNEEGYLVLPGGQYVLDARNQRIEIPVGPAPKIGPSGQVVQDGNEIGRLQVARLEDKSALVKQGDNVFKIVGRDTRQIVDQPRVQPGSLESSGSDPIRTLMSLINSSKAAMSNANMIRYHDLLIDRAVNTLGRVV